MGLDERPIMITNPDDADPGASVAVAKSRLRSKLLAVRAQRSLEERTAAGRAIAEHARDRLCADGATQTTSADGATQTTSADGATQTTSADGATENTSADGAIENTAAGGGGTIAAYLSVGSEPPTEPLLLALAEAGKRLIVPVLTDGGELDWAAYQPGDPVRDGPRRTIHPHGPLLGVDALTLAEAIVVPALAVDRRGRRLGRGGGSYDRALARLTAVRDRPVFAVVFDNELLDEVPTEAHDRPVDGVLTPSGVAFLGGNPAS